MRKICIIFDLLALFLLSCGSYTVVPDNPNDQKGFFNISGVRETINFTNNSITTQNTNDLYITIRITNVDTGRILLSEANFFSDTQTTNVEYLDEEIGDRIKVILYKGYISNVEEIFDGIPDYSAEYTLQTKTMDPINGVVNYNTLPWPGDEPPEDGYVYYEINQQLSGVKIKLYGYYNALNPDEQIYNMLYAENTNQKTVCLTLTNTTEDIELTSMCIVYLPGYAERIDYKRIVKNIKFGDSLTISLEIYEYSDILPGGEPFVIKKELTFEYSNGGP